MVTELPQGSSLSRWSESDLSSQAVGTSHAGEQADALSSSEILHDLSNALAAIVTMTDVVIDEVGTGSAAVEYLRIMRTSASDGLESCQQLRRSLREAGRLDQAQVPSSAAASDPIQLSTLVQEMAAVLQSVAATKSRVRFDLQQELPLVRGCPAQLRQVLMNLVINAAQAQDAGEGTITISTGAIQPSLLEAERRSLMAGQLAQAAYVYLQVTDNGCGMPPEVKQRMFESHFTTKQLGRGDGLSVVRKIVHLHGGAVSVSDVAEGGTAMRLLLPAYVREASLQ